MINVVHGSDSPENAALELKRFFAESELFEFTANVDDPAESRSMAEVYSLIRMTLAASFLISTG